MSGPSAVAIADSDASDGEEEPEAPSSSNTSLRFTEHHVLLKLRLAPLRRLQQDLEYSIGASSGEEQFSTASPVDSQFTSVWGFEHRGRRQEFFIRSNTAWKTALGSNDDAPSRKFRETKAREAIEIIAGCAEDMRTVWEDPTVQQMLQKRRFRMEAAPGL